MREPDWSGVSPKSQLEHQRQEEGRAADGHAKDIAPDNGGAIGGQLQQFKIDRRPLGLARMAGEERQEQDSESPREHHRPDGQGAAADIVESERQRPQSQAGEHETADVGLSGLGLADVGHDAQRECDAQQADGEVDVEDPAPGGIGRDETPDQRADGGTDQRQGRCIADRLDDLRLGDRAQQHEPAHRLIIAPPMP